MYLLAEFIKFLAPILSGKFEFTSGKCQGILIFPKCMNPVNVKPCFLGKLRISRRRLLNLAQRVTKTIELWKKFVKLFIQVLYLMGSRAPVKNVGNQGLVHIVPRKALYQTGKILIFFF